MHSSRMLTACSLTVSSSIRGGPDPPTDADSLDADPSPLDADPPPPMQTTPWMQTPRPL